MGFDDIGDVRGFDTADPDVVRVDHNITARRALPQAFGLGHTDLRMDAAVLGDLSQSAEDLFAVMVSAAGLFAFAVVGADKDLLNIWGGLGFHNQSFSILRYLNFIY